MICRRALILFGFLALALSYSAEVEANGRNGMNVTVSRKSKFLKSHGLSLLDIDPEPDPVYTGQEAVMDEVRDGRLRATHGNDIKLWPKGPSGLYEIPFRFDDTFNDHEKRNVYFAHKVLMRSTNLKFFEIYGDEVDNHVYWIDYMNFTGGSGAVCQSQVGLLNPGSRFVKLAAGGTFTCRRLNLVLHETLHSLGMKHEHQRADRDKYVWIADDMLKNNDYKKLSDLDTKVTPYDLASLMEYSYDEGVIEPRNEDDLLIMDSFLPTPSSCDYHWINTMYPGEKPAPPCQPGVVMEQCKPKAKYAGKKEIELRCRYMCGKYHYRERADQEDYCDFVNDEELPPDPVTEYMKQQDNGNNNDNGNNDDNGNSNDNADNNDSDNNENNNDSNDNGSENKGGIGTDCAACGACVSGPNNQGITDDLCQDCIGGVTWWPCNVQDACFCP